MYRKIAVAILVILGAFFAAPGIHMTAGNAALSPLGGQSQIYVSVNGQDGSPLRFSQIILRFEDPGNSGILAGTGRHDVSLVTDKDGNARGTLNLPPWGSSGKTRLGDFPIHLVARAFAWKHSAGEDWMINSSSEFLVYPYVQRINSVEMSPAEAGENISHSFSLDVGCGGSGAIGINGSTPFGRTVASFQPPPENHGNGTCTMAAPFQWFSPSLGENSTDSVSMGRYLASSSRQAQLYFAIGHDSSLKAKYAQQYGPFLPYSFLDAELPEVPASSDTVRASIKNGASLKEIYSSAFGSSGVKINGLDFDLGLILLEMDADDAARFYSSGGNLSEYLNGSMAGRLSRVRTQDDYAQYMVFSSFPPACQECADNYVYTFYGGEG
jgi:hypothetical protein